jgi:hypothetical protein
MSRRCKNCSAPYRPTSGHNLYCQTCARAAKCRICRKVMKERGWQCDECTAALVHLDGIHKSNIKRPPIDGQEERIEKYRKRAAAGLPLFD